MKNDITVGLDYSHGGLLTLEASTVHFCLQIRENRSGISFTRQGY